MTRTIVPDVLREAHCHISGMTRDHSKVLRWLAKAINALYQNEYENEPEIRHLQVVQKSLVEEMSRSIPTGERLEKLREIDRQRRQRLELE